MRSGRSTMRSLDFATPGYGAEMGLLERIRALLGQRESVAAAEAEDIPPPTDRPRLDQQGFEEMKDDDSVARGNTPVAPSVGPGTASELRDEFEGDQEAPRGPTAGV
jgi:hypothetical protein